MRRPLAAFAIPIISAVGMALITGRYIFLAVIAIGPIFYAVDGVRRRKIQERQESEDLAEYKVALDRFERELGANRTEELRRDRWVGAPPGLSSLLAALVHERIWERSRRDADFCRLALGLADRKSAIESSGRSDPDVTDKTATQWKMVVGHSLVSAGPLSVRGPVERVRATGRALLVDLAVSQSPDDLQVSVFATEDSAEAWQAARFLPHTALGDELNRIYVSEHERRRGMETLGAEIRARNNSDSESHAGHPVHVVLIDGAHTIGVAELRDLLVDGPAAGIVGVVLDAVMVPEGAEGELVLGPPDLGSTFVSRHQPEVDDLNACEMQERTFVDVCQALGALESPSGRNSVDLDSAEIRLVDLIDAPVDLKDSGRLVQAWQQGEHDARLPVGGFGGLPTEIDLMSDGPHALIGGSTRSGKTEFLKTLFISAAARHHPDDLSIVIVDFKGGVDHDLSARLPHVIDLSTNHDVAAFLRTIRLIQAELQRRQLMMQAQGAANLDAYRSARSQQPSLKPLPRLLVVVDEFSELLSSPEGKESLDALAGITRIGGGLGVHLLLATQSFENQLPSQIAVNAGLRICFRVEEVAHSKVVLGSGEAASIPGGLIGRAFWRSKGGPVREFQGARIAGPLPGRVDGELSPVTVRLTPPGALATMQIEERKKDPPAKDTDMYAAIEVIRSAAAASGWVRSAIPWPKELPSGLDLIEVLERTEDPWSIGILDDPDRQSQPTAAIEPYGPNLLFVGAQDAEIGRFMQSALVSAMVRRSPKAFQLYVLDFLSDGLNLLAGFPHCGGLAERDESLSLRMVKHLREVAAIQKASLRQSGHSNASEAIRHGAVLPEILVVVHGAHRLVATQANEQSLVMAPLMNLIAESQGTGVRVLLTGTPGLAHTRLGTEIGRRFVFRCNDRSVYGPLGVATDVRAGLDQTGRAACSRTGALIQFADLPECPDVPRSEFLRCLAERLRQEHRESRGPTLVREVPWPLAASEVVPSDPDPLIHLPIAFAVNTDTEQIEWLDVEEDGPCFAIAGPAKSGRSNALLVATALMMRRGWMVFGATGSRRSPLNSSEFDGTLIADLSELERAGPTPSILCIDDVHKWEPDLEALRSFMQEGPPRALVFAGPTAYFAGRHELLKSNPPRSALLLAPRSAMDGNAFGLSRLAAELTNDHRAGRGLQVVNGEIVQVQVPLHG